MSPIAEPLSRLVSAVRRPRGAAFGALVVFCWAVTLAPLVHGLFHDARRHRHLADGSVELLGDAEPLAGGHVHADGTWHSDHVRAPTPAPGPTRPADPVDGDDPIRDRAPDHGRGSLAHFGVALLAVAPVLLPLAPRDAALLAPPALGAAVLAAERRASRSSRGPPA